MRALARDHPEISRIVLFGSLAAGTPVPGSDADLLIVLRSSELPFLERLVRYRPVLPGLAVDVFVYTEAELERMRSEGNWVVNRALAEGLELDLGR
ncbi:MAG: nucleotidyltransferase domain-containing protein [Bryobacteraceae bacterium]